MRLVFDIETNGLFHDVTVIHSLVILDIDTGVMDSYADAPGYRSILEGIERLKNASELIGHNIINFDLPVIAKLYNLPYDWWTSIKITDTLVACRLIWPDVALIDLKRKSADFPARLTGSHSLEAWGYRLGVLKGTYGKTASWERWTPEMQTYCEQDVCVSATLCSKIKDKDYAPQALELEHSVAVIIARQERYGFAFDVKAAEALFNELSTRRDQLHETLADVFKPWKVQLPDFIPARDNKAKGYVKGVPVKRFKTVTFNPASRDHIADRLKALYDWSPSEFTDNGKAKIDETVLQDLPYPEAKQLAEYFLVQKRLGQVADGKNGWLKVERSGRIHGSVNTNGAVTGRMTHRNPNVAQVPSVSKPYGKACRSCFTASPGRVLVGADAAGLELRMLAHYIARYDSGDYAKALLDGDIHWTNTLALGLVPQGTVFDKENKDHYFARNTVAKRFIYAFLYGAGPAKIGSIVSPTGSNAVQVKQGNALIKRFLANLPALAALLEQVKKRARTVNHLVGLDGRQVPVRSPHAALNTLLQGAGALVMKQALVNLDATLSAQFNGRYEFVANIHDEWQIDTEADIADSVGKAAVAAIVKAGEDFKLRCALDGAYAVGVNWAETH